MNETLLYIIGTGAFSAVVAAIISALETRRYNRSITLHMFRMSFRSLAEQYLTRGSITLDELRDLEDGFELYHNKLKGNGYLTTIMGKVRNLPVKDSA